MNLVSGFPCVICSWVTFPVDEVLKLTAFPMVLMINDLLNLIFFFVTNQFRWWVLELGPIFRSFFVRC